jgi:hypothetical protein
MIIFIMIILMIKILIMKIIIMIILMMISPERKSTSSSLDTTHFILKLKIFESSRPSGK